MRTPTERQLNAVQRPDAYREVLIRSAEAPIALSVWDGQPDRPAVLFLPGTMTHPLYYEEFLDALNRAGLTAVGVHFQGHGKSPRVRRPLAFPTLVTNARDAVAWTRRELPGRPVAVIGSSQGGVVAMALAGAGDELDAVFAHNVLDPSLPSTVEITRFPGWLAQLYPVVVTAFRAGGRLLPRVPVPFDAYLDMARVARDPANARVLLHAAGLRADRRAEKGDARRRLRRASAVQRGPRQAPAAAPRPAGTAGVSDAAGLKRPHYSPPGGSRGTDAASAPRACRTCSIRFRVVRHRRSLSRTSCADSEHRSAARERTSAAA
jgi:alpha-beta hydrolase superfamily lysophospholipase